MQDTEQSCAEEIKNIIANMPFEVVTGRPCCTKTDIMQLLAKAYRLGYADAEKEVTKRFHNVR